MSLERDSLCVGQYDLSLVPLPLIYVIHDKLHASSFGLKGLREKAGATQSAMCATPRRNSKWLLQVSDLPRAATTKLTSLSLTADFLINLDVFSAADQFVGIPALLAKLLVGECSALHFGWG